jgi:hypothetical protein
MGLWTYIPQPFGLRHLEIPDDHSPRMIRAG